MLEENGRVELEWKAGSGLIMRAKGHPADTTMALMLCLRKVVEDNVPPEKQREDMRSFADRLMELMDVTVTEIDLAALRGAGQ